MKEHKAQLCWVRVNLWNKNILGFFFFFPVYLRTLLYLPWPFLEKIPGFTIENKCIWIIWPYSKLKNNSSARELNAQSIVVQVEP